MPRETQELLEKRKKKLEEDLEEVEKKLAEREQIYNTIRI